MIDLRYIFVAIIGMLFVGCGPTKTDRDRLGRAEALVREHPDSALIILDSISPEALASGEFGARAFVVGAEASYKSRLPLPSDSAFEAVIATLSRRKPDSYLARAYFYNGYRKIGEERYIDAIVDLLSAEEIASSLGDVHVTGLAQRNIAEAFDMMNDHASALAFYK